MKKSELSKMTCSLAAALEAVGDAWTLLIVKELMLANRRFEGIQAQTGMSSNSLTSRLKALAKAGIVERQQYLQRPPRCEYRLTKKGEALWPVLVSLTNWGDQFARRGEPPLRFVHKACGDDAGPKYVCAHCGDSVSPRDVRASQSAAMVRDRCRRSVARE